jgi:hypothetical protein
MLPSHLIGYIVVAAPKKSLMELTRPVVPLLSLFAIFDW